MVVFDDILLIAQGTGPSGPLCWAIVIFCVLLGVMVALRPPKRTIEIKRPKD